MPISATQFVIFRLIFGSYLAWHFYTLIEYGPEMFSGSGSIKDPFLNPTWSTWIQISPSMIPKTDREVRTFLQIMVLISGFFAMGIFQNWNSLCLWYGWAFLLNRNNFILNPGIPYVGWLLLACCIIPNPGTIMDLIRFCRIHSKKLRQIANFVHNQINYNSHRLQYKENNDETSANHTNMNENEDEDKSENKNENENECKSWPTRTNWKMPTLIYWGAWFLMGLGYTLSGIDKLQKSPSWREGTALLYVLESLLARDNHILKMIVHMMKNYPIFMRMSTYGSLFLEISFLPLGMFDRLRPVYWMALVLMHLVIIILIDFTDLSLGVLMIHLFTLEIHSFIPRSCMSCMNYMRNIPEHQSKDESELYQEDSNRDDEDDDADDADDKDDDVDVDVDDKEKGIEQVIVYEDVSEESSDNISQIIKRQVAKGISYSAIDGKISKHTY